MSCLINYIRDCAVGRETECDEIMWWTINSLNEESVLLVSERKTADFAEILHNTIFGRLSNSPQLKKKV